VPQVRQSVPGPNKSGEAHDRFRLSVKLNPFGAAEPSNGKQLKNIIFGPGTLMRTWGTRPAPNKVRQEIDFCQV
jgi:hypothetical protein